MQVSINKQEQGIYAIEGELNMQSVPIISKKMFDLMRSEKQSFTLDLSSVSRSDSAGVALLVEAMQLAKMNNLVLSLSNLPQQMQDIAGISGLLDILPIRKL